MSDFDPTEPIRRVEQALINTDPATADRATLERDFGQVWNTDELTQDFDVQGFAAPYVIVRRKADGKLGSLQFRHSPRLYFNFQLDGR